MDTDTDTDGRPELRLALAMRGGVSLAVWIGGACVEIDELRRCTEGVPDADPFWQALVEHSGYGRVVVDVMAGASAGGLNGVLFAAALRHGFPMKDLLPIWVKVASVDELLRGKPPWLSLFDGDKKFLEVIRLRLEGLTSAAGSLPETPYVDLHLATTHLEPLQVPAVQLADETIWRSRSAATFHFRHHPAAAVPRRDLELGGLPRLAVAARATAAFPGAFEAAVVRASRPAAFGDPVPAQDDPQRADCRGVFSDSRGPAQPARGGDLHPEDFVVADGGILDNIPIARALDAIADAPASGPTKRVLVYLHPTGPPPPAGPAFSRDPNHPDDADGPDQTPEQARDGERRRAEARRDVLGVGKGVLSARVQGEGIADDLDQLERLNRAVRVGRVVRANTLSGLDGAPLAAVRRQWPSYRIQRPATDATNLRRLLDDPVLVLGGDPFPSGEGEDRWSAPLVGWDEQSRVGLDAALGSVFRDQLTDDPNEAFVLRAGLAPLRRVVGLLLEWVRGLEGTRVEVSAEKAELYRLASLISLLERVRRLGWVTRAVTGPGDDLAAWCSSSLAWVDSFLQVDEATADALLAGDAAAARSYEQAIHHRLDRGLATGTVEPAMSPAITGDGVGEDLRDRLAERLSTLVDGLLRPAGHAGLDQALLDGRPAALLQHVLHGGGTAPRLAALEVLCLPEFTAGAPGRDEITFARFSAAADTPFATELTALQHRTQEIDATKPDGWRYRPDFLRPEVKLAGNELGNFSAFLSADWRTNDWMWGRLDATAGLIDLLLQPVADALPAADPRPPGTDPPLVPAPPALVELAAAQLAAVQALQGKPTFPDYEWPSTDATLLDVRRALTWARQAQILHDSLHGTAHEDLASYGVGLETITHPGNAEIRRTLLRTVGVARHITNRSLPKSRITRPLTAAVTGVAKVLLWWKARPRR